MTISGVEVTISGVEVTVSEHYREILSLTPDIVPVAISNSVVCYITWHNLGLLHTSLVVKAPSKGL